MSDFGKEVEDYFCRFTFGQFVTLILLELVTLFFVFYLGARYGPDLIGERRSVAERAPAPEEVIEKKPIDYSFPEVLTEGGSGAIKIKPSGMTAKEFEEGQRVVIPVPEKPQEVAGTERPVVAASPPPVIEPASPPAVKGGSFSIQVGSYPTAGEAARTMDRWKGKGYQTFMTVGEIPNKGVWYRVRIGQFKNREEAKLFLDKFKVREKTDGWVVPSKS